MITYSFFHKQTGFFSGNHFSTTAPGEFLVSNNTPPDHIAIEGHHDHLSKRVDVTTGKVVDYIPSQPTPDHEWNDDTKRWVLSQEALLIQQNRQIALSQIALLEASSLRIMREAILGSADALRKLQRIDSDIAILRSDIT